MNPDAIRLLAFVSRIYITSKLARALQKKKIFIHKLLAQ
jgi:hypothetical protein